MENKITQITEELAMLIQEKELVIINVIQDIPPIISTLEKGFGKLKDVISEYKFSSVEQEIFFFKETKPKLFSKLIFLQKVYRIELNRPVSNHVTLKTYLEKEHDQINTFCNKNLEFIQYYRSGKNTLDEYYFVRGRRDMELNLESFYFERDPKFSTQFDFKVAKLLANDMIAAYVNCELAKMYQEENNLDITFGVQSKEKWTDTKVALAEIVYGIHVLHSVNSGNIDIKMLATIFSKMFNVDLSDIYHVFLEIRSRKGDRTVYLNRMIKALNQRMDELDSK